MKKVIVMRAAIVILFCGIASSFGQTVSEEAKRHNNYGIAAVEMAKSPDDYAAAIKQFERAVKLAPDWPEVYYNLGMVQEKAEKYGDAISNLTQYLRLAPNASDAGAVKSLINKLEYKFYNGADINAAELLIAKGGGINARGPSGETPLHEAADLGWREVAELLIAEGADVNAKGREDWTPLHDAAYQGKKELAELLIAKGADINAKDKYGDTPLQIAESNKHKEVADLLRKHGAK